MQMFLLVIVLSQEAVIDVLENSFDNSLEWSMWSLITSVVFFSYSFIMWFPGDGEGRNTANFYYSMMNEN